MMPGEAAVMKRSVNAPGVCCRTAQKQPAFVLHGRQVIVGDLGNGLRGVEDLGPHHIAPLHHGHEIREFGHVLRRRALALAAKTPHALRHIGLKTDARLFAVVDDIHPGFELLGNHVLDGDFGLALQGRGLYGLALLLVNQQIGQLRAARQAADMGGENTFVALLHN